MDDMKIAFLGIGLMGFPMARNLLQAGFKAYDQPIPFQCPFQQRKMSGGHCKINSI